MTVGSLHPADEVCHRRCLFGLLQCGEVADPCVCHLRLRNLVMQIAEAQGQLGHVHRHGGSRRVCKKKARVRRGSCGAAVGAPVAELFSSDDLALAVTEPRVAAPTAEQQLVAVLATCVARVRSGRQQCGVHGRRGGARSGGVRHTRRHLGTDRRDCTCSTCGAAVDAGVALSCSGDLALAVAESHDPAPAAAQKLAPALAAGVARGRGWSHRRGD